MPLPRTTSWLPITGVLVPVALALIWLLVIFAGDRRGAVPLPQDAAGTIELLADATRRMTRAEVERAGSAAWQRVTGDRFVILKPGEIAWLRVTLRNPTPEPQLGVLMDDYFFNDHEELWTRSTSPAASPERDEWRAMRSGEGVAPDEKPLRGRVIAFPVSVPAHGERVLLLRAEDRFRVFTRLVWWPEQAAYHAAQTRRLVAEGIYLGGLLALLGYNTLLWLRLRFADMGYYVLYLGTNAAFFGLARAGVMVLGGRLESPAMEMAITLAMAFSGLFLIRFAAAFLDLAKHSPRADRIARGLAIAMLVLAALGLSLPWMKTVWPFAFAVLGDVAAHVVLLVLAVGAWRAGVWQARYFLLSSGFLFAGSLATTIGWLSHVSSEGNMMGIMVGSALEMLLLSLAVAERFARTQRELATETERRRALQEAYADELEAEVRDRTRELEEANADKDRMLSIIGHDLRSPLAGLMRAADDEAGTFARETAHTGRALLLLIEDLVLWARLRAGTRQMGSHPARSLFAPAVALHRALAERGGTELGVSVPDGLRVETDLVLAQTLVRNLLANALKFARTRVALRAEETREGGVRITVGNDGPPLPPAVAARFAAGQNEPMTATGGLGLRLCREICHAFGTRLEAGTGADGGTEFSFTLPAPRGAEIAHT